MRAYFGKDEQDITPCVKRLRAKVGPARFWGKGCEPSSLLRTGFEKLLGEMALTGIGGTK
jgi:hypothetical protein